MWVHCSIFSWRHRRMKNWPETEKKISLHFRCTRDLYRPCGPLFSVSRTFHSHPHSLTRSLSLPHNNATPYSCCCSRCCPPRTGSRTYVPGQHSVCLPRHFPSSYPNQLSPQFRSTLQAILFTGIISILPLSAAQVNETCT